MNAQTLRPGSTAREALSGLGLAADPSPSAGPTPRGPEADLRAISSLPGDSTGPSARSATGFLSDPVVVGLVALLLALAAAAVLRRLGPVRRRQDGHERLVLDRAGIDAVDRRVLRRLAARTGQPSPVTLLLGRGVFEEALAAAEGDLSAADRRRLHGLRQRLGWVDAAVTGRGTGLRPAGRSVAIAAA